MDQIKIGRFIAETRKKKNLTQKQLAEKLLISDKTVSKWECGKGLPEVSMMMPLCKELEITVNELLSGESMSDSEYKSKAEETIMNLVKEKEESKRKIILSAVVCFLTILSGVIIILLSGIAELKSAQRIALIAAALVIIVGGIAVAAALDLSAGTFECPVCSNRFVPSAGAYIKGPHTLLKRRLKCPHCGKTSFCKRHLTH